jgi:hypothetical protein
MKKVDANCHIEVLCNCPYCDAYEDIFDNDNVKESMGNDHRAENCELEVSCSECGKTFIVENIHF